MYDRILSEITSRFTQLLAVASDFGFLDGKVLFQTSVADLKKATADLALKYSEDLDFTEFQLEVESFKHQARVLTSLHGASSIDTSPGIERCRSKHQNSPQTTSDITCDCGIL